ncbi:hypothetical protein CIB84_003205, partial [Bambusicola thoracicus]
KVIIFIIFIHSFPFIPLVLKLYIFVSLQVSQPRQTIWVSQKIFPTSQEDGGFLKGCLPISKEVNRKKESEVEGACWAPVNGDGHHFTKINYLYTF